MMIARILSPVLTLGPGRRTAVWVCGCGRKCPNCANPELWEYDRSKDIPVGDAMKLIRAAVAQGGTGGFTITGGEPFDQPEDLAELVWALRALSEDILIYTGYTLAELKEKRDGAVERALSGAAALIDGPYIDERNNSAPMRGSDNQTVHILNWGFESLYKTELGNWENRIQNFPVQGGVISVGIHKKGFRRALRAGLAGYRLEEN